MYAANLNQDDEFAAHEIVLFESTGVGEPPPSFAEDEDYAISLEAALVDLGYLADDMIKAGGMNQQFAMEAHRLMPDMAQKYPLGYFSKTTTGTLYQPALEELHVGIWALIGAATAGIAMLIWKFVRWVIKKWKGEDVGGGDGRPSDSEISEGVSKAVQVAEEKVHQNDAVVEELKELKPELDDAVSNLDKMIHQASPQLKAQLVNGRQNVEDAAKSDTLTSEHVGSFEEVAEILMTRHDTRGRFKALREYSNNAWFDIVEGGRWSTLMLSLGPILSSLEAQIVQRVQTFESIFSVTQTQGDPVRYKNAQHLIEQVKQPIKLPGTNYNDLQQLARSLDNPAGLMTFNAAKKKFNPVEAVDKVTALMAGSNYKALLNARVKSIEKLALLNAQQMKLSEIANKWNAPHPGQGVGVGVPKEISRELGGAIAQLQRDTTYLMQVNVAVDAFVTEVSSLSLEVSDWWSAIFTLLGHHAANTKVPEGQPKIEMPASTHKAMGIISGLRKAMGKVPASEIGYHISNSLSKVKGAVTGAAKSAASKVSGAADTAVNAAGQAATHAANAASNAAGHAANAVSKLGHAAVNAGAAPQSGSVNHPKNAVAPGMGARQIPTKDWQKK